MTGYNQAYSPSTYFIQTYCNLQEINVTTTRVVSGVQDIIPLQISQFMYKNENGTISFISSNQWKQRKEKYYYFMVKENQRTFILF